jgi:single-stranded DNA-binding protein
MNRWTGTGHLTKDPQFLETEDGTAICALRISVKRAGKQGHDGYFDVKCFDARANACAQYLKADARSRSTAACSSMSSRPRTATTRPASTSLPSGVEFLASRTGRQNGQASPEASPEQPATGEPRERHPAA